MADGWPFCSMSKHHYFGKYCEHRVIGELLKLNYDVALPIVDDRGVDCVILKRDGKYIDLQIKGRQPNWLFNIGKMIPRKNYFFMLVPPGGDIYVVPSKQLSIWLNGKPKVTLSGKKLNKYKGAYSLLTSSD